MKNPTPRTVQTILKKLRVLYPDAQCALDHKNPFELLVATILSAQCTDKRVNMITPALFKTAPTPEQMLKMGQARLQEAIRSCGFYQAKAKNILGACRGLLEKHGGKVPQDLEALTELPGVGRKTAGVILANAFGVPALPVDTHVFRVAQRLGLAQAKTPDQLEKKLMEAIPKKDWIDTHHLLIFHGRNLCRARNPLCEPCPLKISCLYYQKIVAPK
jgi:endonuclease-3